MHRAKLSAALSRERGSRLVYYAIGALLCLAAGTVCDALADGKLVPPRDYRGSLEEQAQEAVIIFHGSSVPGEAREDLILKITVAGGLPVSEFGWVVPFPQEPTVQREDAALFRELFDYVQRRRSRPADDAKAEGAKAAAPEAEGRSQGLSRQVVGVYDVAVVRENVAGKLRAGERRVGKEGRARGEPEH